MDPDANYAEQKRLYNSKDARDRARLRELVAALRGWIAAGGFKPSGFVGAAWKPGPIKAPSVKQIAAAHHRYGETCHCAQCRSAKAQGWTPPRRRR